MLKVKRVTRAFSIEVPQEPFIWHLFPAWERFKLDSLLAGQLYLARLDQFDDPLEGSLPHKNRSLLCKAPKYAQRYIRAAYSRAVRQSFATCWHRSLGDPSDYVWNQFGGDHNGIAIRSTPRRLMQTVGSLLESGAGHFGSVRYIDHKSDNDLSMTNILEAHFVVRDDYEREEEARFLVHTYGLYGSQLTAMTGPKGVLVRPRRTKHLRPRHEFVGGYKRGTAILLPATPELLIKEVVLGKNIDPDLASQLRMEIAAHRIQFRLL